MNAYLKNLARDLIGKIGMTTDDQRDKTSFEFWYKWHHTIEYRISKWKPETLGKVIAGSDNWGSGGCTSIFQTRNAKGFGIDVLANLGDGKVFLSDMAVCAIAAAMFDILSEKAKKAEKKT